METIIDYLKRNLKDAGPKCWPAIASDVSAALPDDEKISEHFLRKIAYGDRDNPGVKSVQPLIDYFHAVERGDRQLPAVPTQNAEQMGSKAAGGGL